MPIILPAPWRCVVLPPKMNVTQPGQGWSPTATTLQGQIQGGGGGGGGLFYCSFCQMNNEKWVWFLKSGRGKPKGAPKVLDPPQHCVSSQLQVPRQVKAQDI